MGKKKWREGERPPKGWDDAAKELALALWKGLEGVNSGTVMHAFAMVLAGRLVEFDGELSESEREDGVMVGDSERLEGLMESVRVYAASLREGRLS